MKTFLDGAFSTLFSAANWKADWSRASDTPIHSQVSLSVSIETSITANEPALQKLAAAYAMIGDLGAEQMNGDSYGALLKSAMETIDSGVRELTKTQAKLGVVQSTVKNASEMMSIQSDTLQSHALTARISQLSLIKYL